MNSNKIYQIEVTLQFRSFTKKIYSFGALITYHYFKTADTYDTEEQRITDRIRCIALREAWDTGTTFISRNWIAEKIHRSIRFITDWWQQSYDQCFSGYSNTSQENIFEASDRQKKSYSLMTKEIAEKRKVYVFSITTVIEKI